MDYQLLLSALWATFIFLRQVRLFMVPYYLALGFLPRNKFANFKPKTFVESGGWTAGHVDENIGGIIPRHIQKWDTHKQPVWGGAYHLVNFYLKGKAYRMMMNDVHLFLITQVLEFLDTGVAVVKERIDIGEGFSLALEMTRDEIIQHVFASQAWSWNNNNEKRLLVDYSYKRNISVNILGPLSVLSVYLTTRKDLQNWQVWIGVTLPIFLDMTTRIWRMIFDRLTPFIVRRIKLYILRGEWGAQIRAWLSLVFNGYRICDNLAGMSYMTHSKFIAITYNCQINYWDLGDTEMVDIDDLVSIRPAPRLPATYKWYRNTITLNDRSENGEVGFTYEAPDIGIGVSRIGMAGKDLGMCLKQQDFLLKEKIPVLETLRGDVGHVLEIHFAYFSGQRLAPILLKRRNNSLFRYYIDDSHHDAACIRASPTGLAKGMTHSKSV